MSDYDDMPPVTNLGSRRIKHAVTEHWCQFGHTIAIGQSYDQLKLIVDGQFTVLNYCNPCLTPPGPTDDQIREEEDQARE